MLTGKEYQDTQTAFEENLMLALQATIDAQPHYIIAPTVSDWHSEPYPNKAAAQKWLDGYMVNPAYKEQTYKIVPVAAYWERHQKKVKHHA